MMEGSLQPSRADIDAFLSMAPDVPEPEFILRLKVTFPRPSAVFVADVNRETTIMSNKPSTNILTFDGSRNIQMADALALPGIDKTVQVAKDGSSVAKDTAATLEMARKTGADMIGYDSDMLPQLPKARTQLAMDGIDQLQPSSSRRILVGGVNSAEYSRVPDNGLFHPSNVFIKS